MEKIDRGVNRPGQLVRHIDGLTTKVMNESLQRLIDYQVLVKQVFDEKPPRVEYELTPFGREVLEALQSLNALQSKYSALLLPGQ
jgi:DNA-binding HxlR family transcriptional regulator